MTFQVFSQLEPLYKELTELHYKTQTSIKELERISLKLEIPAINELRNALYHLNLALTLEQDSQELELKKALNHCKRAYYDSKEIMLMFLLKRVEEIKTDIAGHSHILRTHIQDYNSKKTKLQEALDFIQKASPYKNKEKFYEDCDEHIENVLGYIKGYESSKEDIDSEISERKEKKKINKVLLGLAILGAIYPIVNLLCTDK